jgi:hypothetical protein
MPDQALQERYAAAVEHLVELAESDPMLIGLYVYGSAQRGDVWSHSDIDAVFVTSDESRPWQAHVLVEDGICIDAEICSRSHFRQIHERSLRGSTIHAIFSSGRLVYATEPTLEEYLDQATEVGERDVELLRLRLAVELGGSLHLAEKALGFRRDAITGFFRIVACLRNRASLELLAHGEPLRRDAVARACELNQDYERLRRAAIAAHEDANDLLDVHRTLKDELRANAHILYKPILDYLREERRVRTAFEIHRAVGERANLPSIGLAFACNELADLGLVEQTTHPVRLTRKGRVEFEEAAYFYGGDA